MVDAWNLAMGWVNLADTATITASSFSILTPPSTLIDPHVGRKWRGTDGASEYVVVDHGGTVSADTFMLLGLDGLFGTTEVNLDSTAVTRIRLSSVDSSGAAGDVYDSGSAAGRIDQKWPNLFHLLDDPRSYRYLRFDLSQAGATYLQAGRVGAFARAQFVVNIQPGMNRGYVDRSLLTESRGGQIYVDHDNNYRVLDFSLELVKESQRWSIVDEIDRLCGISTDVLVMIDPDSDYLGRDTIWGLMIDLTMIGQPRLAWVEGEVSYSKSYRIQERL